MNVNVKFLVLILVTSISVLLDANNILCGQNLVVNPGFEEYSDCPSETNQIDRTIGWDVALGSPDYYNRCAMPTTGLSQSVEVPDNYHGSQEPFAGDAYGGYFTVGEYLRGQFTTPLISDSCYYVEFQVSLAEFSNRDFTSCDRFGLYFSSDAITFDVATMTPQLTILDLETNFDDWILVSGYYTAVGGERYMTIGGFDLCPSRSFYYVDDFKVIPSSTEEDTVYHCFASDGCYFIAGDAYCDPGEYSITIGSPLDINCSNTYNLVLIDDSQHIDIIEEPDYDCNGGFYTLTFDSTTLSSETDVEWTGPSGFASSDVSTEVTELGTYYLTIFTTGSSCTSTDSIVVTSTGGSLIDINLENAILTCDNPVITLDPASTISDLRYSWSGPGISSTSPTIDVAEAGIYSVTLSAIGYCELIETVTVTDIRTLSGEISTPPLDSLCDSSYEDIILQASANEVNVSYLWSTGSTDASIAINDSDTYTVTITSDTSSCIHEESVSIQRPPELTITTSADLDCNTLSSSLTVITSVGGLTYEWTGPSFLSADSVIVVDQPGRYILSAYDPASGCSLVDSTEVTQDLTSVISSVSKSGDIDCSTNEINLTATTSISNATFEWTGPSGSSYSGESINVSVAGSYSVTITNVTGTCTDVDTIVVNVIGDFLATTIEKSNDLNCNAGNAQLTAASSSSDWTYLWTYLGAVVSDESSITVDNPGDYTVVITDADGCSGTNSIEVLQTDILDASFSTIQADCLDELGSITIENVEGGVAPLMYSVTGGADFSASPNFENLDNGEYEIIVQDGSDCQYTAGVVDILEFEIPTVSLPDTIFVEENTRVIIRPELSAIDNEIASIEWIGDADISCIDCLTPSVLGLEDAELEVNILYEDECLASATVVIIVIKVNNDLIYIPNIFSQNELSASNRIFNPFASTEIEARVLQFNIYDRWGNLVFSAENFLISEASANGWDGTYDGRSAELGVYIYSLNLEYDNGDNKQLSGSITLL